MHVNTGELQSAAELGHKGRMDYHRQSLGFLKVWD